MSTNDLLTLGRRVRIIYKDQAGEVTERVIDVERIYTSGTGATVVIAFCHRRGATRTFDASRIIAAMPDDSTTITSFAMSAAVTAQDTERFHAAREAFYAA
jgi:predicted DNA-binding transcriptional regulator YafY